MQDRPKADTELLWQAFHEVINMTSEELRAWLLAQARGPQAVGDGPGPGLPRLGERVVDLLRKRKADLTDDDALTMGAVVDIAETLIAHPPDDGVSGERWRRSLMTVGHDPRKL